MHPLPDISIVIPVGEKVYLLEVKLARIVLYWKPQLVFVLLKPWLNLRFYPPNPWDCCLADAKLFKFLRLVGILGLMAPD